MAALPPTPAMEDLPPTFDDETLVARPSTLVPTIDGVAETLWDGAHDLEILAAGMSGTFLPGSGVHVRALHNYSWLFLLVTWPDVAPDRGLDAWQLVDNSTPGGNWTRTGWGHDSFAVYFDDGLGAERNFSAIGCSALCHAGPNQMHTTSPGFVDLWDWSASRSNALGIAQDRYLDSATKQGGSPTGGFHPDVAEPWTDNNVTSPYGPRPEFLNASAPSSATHILDTDKQAINWSTFDSGSLPNGTVVPGWVLSPPAAGDSDVTGRARHNGTGWTLEMARPFVTGDNSSRDISIDDLGTVFHFSIALTNNLTGEDHSTPLLGNKLVFAENLNPDYVVRSAVPQMASVEAGTPANITLVLGNNGFGNATVPVAVAVVDLGSSTEVARVGFGPLAWSEERVMFILVPTAGYAPGVHDFMVVADVDDGEAESNESNNGRPFNLTVTASTVFPDVVVSSVAGPSGPVFVPENITITGTVTNLGAGDTVGDVLVRASNVSMTEATANLGLLLAGQSANFSLNLSTDSVPGDSYLVSVVADPYNTVDEGPGGAELNNTAVVIATVEARAALAAATLTLFPAAVLAGESTNLTVTVTNEGARASGTLTVWTYLDNTTSQGLNDRVLVWTALVSLSRGEFQDIATSWQVPPGLSVGPHSIRVWLDAEGAFDEVDESDNNANASLLVLEAPRPDLTFASGALDKASYTAGEVATVTANVTNVGANYTRLVVVEVRGALSNVRLGSVALPAVQAGETRQVTAAFTVPADLAGTHLLTVAIDPDDELAETSEFNNSLTLSYTLLAELVGDLTVEAMTATPPLPSAGDLIQLRAEVFNNGTGATEATDGVFRLGAGVLGYVPVPALAPGLGTTVTLEWDTTGFTGLQALVSFHVDVNNTVSEVNEANNTASLTLHFTRPGEADLRLGPVVTVPDSPAPGAVVRIEVAVNNSGTVEGSARLRILVDGVAVFEGNVSVPPGASQTLTANWTANTSGAHFLRIELLVGAQVADIALATIPVAYVEVPPAQDLTWLLAVLGLVAVGGLAYGVIMVWRKPAEQDSGGEAPDDPPGPPPNAKD